MKQKYAKFNEEVAAQESHVNDVMKLADLLIESKHPDEIVIRRRREVNIDVGSRESWLAWIVLFLKSLNFTYV